MNHGKLIIVAAILSLILGLQTSKAEEPTLEEAKKKLEALAEAKRLKSAPLTFEQFKASVYQEPFEGGKFIFNGDTAIPNEKALKEFFEANVKNKPQSSAGPGELIVMSVGGLDAVWSEREKRGITYCVSNTFGQRYAE